MIDTQVPWLEMRFELGAEAFSFHISREVQERAKIFYRDFARAP
jgi:hypothetical protein